MERDGSGVFIAEFGIVVFDRCKGLVPVGLE
jgi:hypothetical protein